MQAVMTLKEIYKKKQAKAMLSDLPCFLDYGLSNFFNSQASPESHVLAIRYCMKYLEILQV